MFQFKYDPHLIEYIEYLILLNIIVLLRSVIG